MKVKIRGILFGFDFLSVFKRLNFLFYSNKLSALVFDEAFSCFEGDQVVAGSKKLFFGKENLGKEMKIPSGPI